MHIKQVIISGFRSFRSQNEIETFSPKHNVIVGRNGSGKSNFFDAIQFVLLGPKFSTLRQEDRQHLLHEGAGSSVMAAFVEIIFDNTDGRLSVDGDEVILRRTVGHKKDEFFLNRKRVQKSEVMSLLESAGFSKSNPYYIVQQGKVANLCVMKDKDRLDLLKGVAGTTVYEERRAESMKIIQDTAHKKEKVEEVLQLIEDRLGELEQEKTELTEYEELDRQRRAIDIALYEKQHSKASEQLGQIEEVQEHERARQSELYTAFSALQDSFTAQSDHYDTLQSALQRLLTRRDALNTELTTLIAKRSAVEVELQETEASSRAKHTETIQYTEQLRELSVLIQQAEEKLSHIEQQYTLQSTELSHLQTELIQISSNIETLYGKQGRGLQFHNKTERDQFLQTQIDTLEQQIQQKTQLLQRNINEIQTNENRLNNEKSILISVEKQQNSRIERLNNVTVLINDLITKRNNLHEKRKINWKNVENLTEKITETKQEYEKNKQLLNRSLPRHIVSALYTIEDIVKRKNITGYYGPLINNITLNSELFRTAIEVSAGNALFHIIVDTDTTAAFLINELDRLKAGRLTFLPLNRLQDPVIVYPESRDARSLMQVALTYEKKFELAVKQVFGHKLFVRDLDIAAQYSKECNLDAITKEGDQVNRKGGFEGGFHDDKLSRLGAYYKITETAKLLEELSAQEVAMKEQTESLEAEINEVMRELQQLELEKVHLRQNGEQLSREIATRTKQLEAAVVGLDSQKRGIETLRGQIQVATQQQQSFTAEQASPLVDKLSNKERNELTRLEHRQRELQSAIEVLETEVMTVTTAKEQLSADLESNLRKRQEELELTLSAAADDATGEQDYETKLSELHSNQDQYKTLILTTQTELKEMNTIINKKRAEHSILEKQLEEERESIQQQQEQIDEVTTRLDKLLNKRSMLREIAHSKQRMIRDLGTAPTRELAEVQKFSEKQLESRRDDVNKQLKKYSKVNRKAIEQFLGFSERRQQLVEHYTQMEVDGGKIQELIESLDAQKDEAILRTFRGVSKHFTEVFAELVPGGVGQLIMRTTADHVKETTEESAEDTTASTGNLQDRVLDTANETDTAMKISTFQGIQVRVSFSGTGQQYQMQQLSGGQKALVALALIFAIQRCDPAPFYLFDEIDQALDANYRAGVAKLIQKQVNSPDASAQFITTTFRPELVSVADRCYGIGLKDKVSKIDLLDKSVAQDFVTNLMLEEEAVGRVSAVPGRSSHPQRWTGHALDMSRDGAVGDSEVGSEDEAGLPSPPKIRRLQRGSDTAAVTSGGQQKRSGGKAKKGLGKSAAKQRGSKRQAAESASEEESEEEDSESEEEGREGMIELDAEEAAAFATLDLHDEDED